MGLEGNQRNDSMKHKFTNKAPRAPSKGAEGVLGKAEIKDFLTIRIAGNEQLPLDFNSDYVKSGRGPIKTFDYCLEGDQDRYAIERKSVSDYIGSLVLSKNWAHELAKIERAREWLLPTIYVVEGNFDDIRTYDYTIFPSGRVTSQMVYKKWAQMVFELSVHVIFTGSREAAAYAVALILKRRHEALRTDK